MTIKGMQAWVTSATDEKTATHSLVLAASLRRVRTAKKLAVFTTSAIAEEMRDKLEKAFDLVLLIEHKTLGVVFEREEDLAKIQAFSLSVFSKCVFLAPQTMVVNNCDNIFETYGSFVISRDKDESSIDTSVLLFTPSSRIREELKYLAKEEASRADFSQLFTLWLEKHVSNYDNLGMEYNMKLDLNNSNGQDGRLERGVVIVNFVDAYPLDFPQDKVHSGVVAQFATTLCWSLYKSTVAVTDLKASPSPPCESEPIAIVGLNFRLPGGNTPDDFWELLAQGKEASKTLPPFRWTKGQTSIGCTNRNIQVGFLSIPVDEFDSKFFGISRKDLVYLDPQQRLLHEVSWHAIEDARIDPLSLHLTKTGIFVGTWLQNYKDSLTKSAEYEFFRAYLGNSIAAMAARLAHFFRTTGPTIATESACSSGIVAVDMACKSLRNHDSNLALACGVNLILDPFDEDGFSFVVAPDGRCKTFDAKAGGFGRAEGCVVLVLKRLSDAVREENRIWGLIRGSAIVQEGASNSLGTPTVHCESLAIKLALEEAGVEPNDVSYMEAHGTGTPVGDPLEIKAIAKHYSSNKRIEPLMIGSVKTNIGHTESVSGLAGIIKVLLSLKNETIPAHLNFESLNPEIQLDTIPAKIPLQSLPWRKEGGKPRLAGVSSFGISGTDGHVIIEEAPPLPKSRISSSSLERPLHIMKISAKSPDSMKKLIEIYSQTFSDIKSDIKFADLAFSANTGRATFNHRAVIIAKDVEDAGNQLRGNSFRQAEVTAQSEPICFLFSGQGSQYPNMASTLYSTSPIFKAHFDDCCSILETRYNIPLKRVLWGDSCQNLSETIFSQTSIFCVEYCLLKLWESWGVKPDFVLGHSLGEFAAAVAAQLLNFEDALMLVAERSRLIVNHLPRGKMLVLGGDKEKVDEQITNFKEIIPESWLDIAALNSPEQTVVASEPEFIEDFAKFCEGNGLKATCLEASHAFHSRQMDEILEEYGEVASSIKTRRSDGGDYPKYISGVEGKLIDSQQLDGDYWLRQTREKVNFIEACEAIQSQGCRLFLEIGPHPVLSALMMSSNMDEPSVKCFPSLRRNEDDWTTLMTSLANLYLSDWKGDLDWNRLDLGYPRERVDDLPLYPFDRKPSWVKFRRPVSELHPLLGTMFPTAANVSVFEREMTVKNTGFVKDHVFGSTIIFPGAAFLEMALAGGYASAHGLTEEWTLPRRGIQLSNLKIIRPLALHESQHCIIQTIVSLDASADVEEEDKGLSYSVSIYHNSDPESTPQGNWILHASATFQPKPTAQMMNNKTEPPALPLDFDIPTIKSSWEQVDTKTFYDKLPKLGLRFGGKFESLQRGWKNESAGILVQIKFPNESGFLVHPVIADAMMQAMMLWEIRDEEEGAKIMKLQVPVCIGQFSWLRHVDEESCCYIYASGDKDGDVYSILLDEKGTILADMRDVTFTKTSAKLIEELADHHNHTTTLPLPEVWEEVWKPRTNDPAQFRVDELHFPTQLPEGIEQRLRQLNDVGSEERRFGEMLSDLEYNYVLKAIYELGWKPSDNNNGPPQSSMNNIFDELSITKPSHKNFVSFFLRPLLGNKGGTALESSLEFVSPPPPMEECLLSIERICNSVDESRMEYKLTRELGEVLHQILCGDVDPLAILFPENSSKPNAREFYVSVGNFVDPVFNLTFESFYIDTIVNAMEANERKHGDKGILRILEVGAGTGCLTRNIVSDLLGNRIKFEYIYTDISSAFFPAAEKEFEHLGSDMIFKKFDMEKDPLEQGFCPEYFDVVVACEVLHVARHIEKTVRKLRALLKPNGLVLVVETTEQVPTYMFSWGLLEEYWSFEDQHLRNSNHINLPAEKWVDVFHSADFERVEWRPAKDGTHGVFLGFASRSLLLPLEQDDEAKHVWLIFDDESEFTTELQRKLIQVKRKVIVFSKPSHYAEESLREQLSSVIGEICESAYTFEGVVYLWGLVGASSSERVAQTEISLPMLSLCQLLVNYEQPKTRVYMLTQGMYSVGDSAVLNPSCGTLRGILGAISAEKHLQVTLMDLSPDEAVTAQVDQVFMNLWGESNEICASREGIWQQPKYAPLKIAANDYLQLPNGCGRFQLELPSTKLFADLEFTFLDEYTLGGDDVEIEVKAYSLNFRDLFAVLKPSSDFDNLNVLGSDLAGVVRRVGSQVTGRKVGDRVIAMNRDENISLPSHVKMGESETVLLPKSMTFAEGSTFPAVVSTVHLCLVNVGKVERGESLLIHTASGGVGLCAIQLAVHLGAHIIATAGSSRKRNFLRSLGIEHVFHSRTTEFSKQILEATNGKGVDVVLNSLTGPGLKEASLECLAKGGRFIEMSKLNVWTGEEVQQLRPDVLYAAVDLMKLSSEEYKKLTEERNVYLSNELIKPIPYDRFDALNIRGALNYLQKAKHIGKVVCVMPEVKLEKSKLVVKTPLFNDESTYIVTGGLGGIGFEVVKWMLESGAKHIVIVSRSHPNPDMTSTLESWNNTSGKHVKAFSVDVGSFGELQQLFELLQLPTSGFPTIRGVMHAAGVLWDGTLENQSWTTFQHTFQTKVDGSWNLHQLTKNLPLEHFVFFSSVAATIGAKGQANHCASNSFEDTLAHYRKFKGLPATTVNWANWGEVGVAAGMDFPGLSPISTAQGLLALETFLRTQITQAGVANVESFALVSSPYPGFSPIDVDDKRLFSGESKYNTVINREQFWSTVAASESGLGRFGVFKDLIKNILRNMLKMEATEEINDKAEFHTLRVDSLMMLEMRNAMQNVFGSRLTLTAAQLKDCSNTELLANKFVSLFEEKAEN